MVGIVVREVREADLPRMAEFLVNGFPQISPPTWNLLFDMYWHDNPVFDPERTRRGWVLEKGSDFCGFMGSIPVKFLIRGKEALGVAGASWYVEPDIRGIYSIQLFSSFHKQDYASLFLQTTPIGEIHTILGKFGYSRLVIPSNRMEYLNIIDYSRAFRLFLNYIKKSSRPLRLYQGKGGILPPLPRFRPKISSRNSEHLVCSLTSVFDSSFEDLWRSTLKGRAYVTELSRDIKTMNWLYFSPAVLHKRRVVQCRNSQDSSLLGYMVFDIKDQYHGDNPILQMIDVCIPGNGEDVIEAMVVFAIKLAKKEGASLVSLTAWSPQAERFFNSYFTIHRAAEYDYYYKFAPDVIPAGQDPSLNPSLIDPDRGCLS